MAVEDRIIQVKHLLDRVSNYNRLVTSDSFEAATIADMKGNAKEICDQVKDEITQIKSEIDQWS